MNTNRNKYLTEAMGLRHENKERRENVYYCFCGKVWGSECAVKSINWCIDFSIWQGFGKLWEWAQDKEWFGKFYIDKLSDPVEDIGGSGSVYEFDNRFINPDRFSNALYEFLINHK